MGESKRDTCPACGANVGELHRAGCDVEPCPHCGRQLSSCGHFQFGSSNGPPDHMRLPWEGEWHGELECREFGWYSKLTPDGPGYVPCGADEPGASPDLNRLRRET